MDRNFYEFWGRYFLALARGRQQFEDVTAWMRQGFQGSESLTEFFRKAYGLDRERETDITVSGDRPANPISNRSTNTWPSSMSPPGRTWRPCSGKRGTEAGGRPAEETVLPQQNLLAEKGLDPSAMIEGSRA
jgi:hypothetical protein